MQRVVEEIRIKWKNGITSIQIRVIEDKQGIRYRVVDVCEEGVTPIGVMVDSTFVSYLKAKALQNMYVDFFVNNYEGVVL